MTNDYHHLSPEMIDDRCDDRSEANLSQVYAQLHTESQDKLRKLVIRLESLGDARQ